MNCCSYYFFHFLNSFLNFFFALSSVFFFHPVCCCFLSASCIFFFSHVYAKFNSILKIHAFHHHFVCCTFLCVFKMLCLDFSFCVFLDNVQRNFRIVHKFAENICRMIVRSESRISGPESESECFRTRSHSWCSISSTYITQSDARLFFFIHIITAASNVFDLCEYKTRYNNRIVTTYFSSALCAGLNFQ